MTITELIKKLENAKKKYGDIQVTRYVEDYEQGDYHALIEKIRLIKAESHSYDEIDLPYIYLK